MHSIMAQSEWLPNEKLIITQISGDADELAIAKWDNSLQNALAQVPDNGNFKIFINLYGFTALNVEAHKKFRTIIPATLANYGWKTGYVNLFAEAADLPITHTRGISCVAAAHVHQDETKIKKYDLLFGKNTERFFTDPTIGENWIRNVKIEPASRPL